MSYKKTFDLEPVVSTEEPLTPERLRALADEIERRAGAEGMSEPHIYFMDMSEWDERFTISVGSDWHAAGHDGPPATSPGSTRSRW